GCPWWWQVAGSGSETRHSGTGCKPPVTKPIQVAPATEQNRANRSINMSQGKIVQIIGAVVDVEFPRAEVPKVYDALKVDGTAITLEVQQQLGDGVVRTIALGSTDGLKRNLVATNTGTAISVPVGAGTLGR